MVIAAAALPWTSSRGQLVVDLLLTGSLLLVLVAHRALQRPSQGLWMFVPQWWGVVLAVALLRGLAPNELWSGGVAVLGVAWLGWNSHRAAQAAQAERRNSTSVLWPWDAQDSGHPRWHRALQLSWALALMLVLLEVLARCRS
jgi:hypothetical protein